MKKKALSLLLSAAMILTMMPAMVFAQTDGAGRDAAATTEMSAQESQNSFAAEISQSKLNFRDVELKIPDVENILANESADAVFVDAYMSYEGNITTEVKKEFKLADLNNETKSVSFELPYFGKYSAKVSFMRNGTEVGSTELTGIAVAAEEYNIAAFPATTDVLIFSLKYLDGSMGYYETAGGDPVPTVVTISRPKQYDWDKLPENMYRNPLLSEEENLSTSMSWDELQNEVNRVDRLVQYVKDLNEIREDSKFNFFINDYHLYSFPRLSYGNGLKDGQYTLTIVTDGSATYNNFKLAYEGKDDAQEEHDILVSEYKAFKRKVIAGKTTDYFNLRGGTIRIYPYAIMDAEDGRWWVVRKSTDTFGLTDTSFQQKVLADSRVTSNYINGLLTKVKNNNNEETFKNLYKFDDEAFNATRAKGKKIMMIIGTSKSIEDKYPVTDYVRFMVATMGDEYEFYYKGHPGNYTANSPENVAKYASMGIQMLEPSIAAELFLFYNDDLYMCGYESSLYTNASNEKSEEQDVALFRRTKETAYADSTINSYVGYMDMFISDLTDAEDTFTYKYDESKDPTLPGMKEAKEAANALREKMLQLIPDSEKSDRTYLVEYNNNDTKTVSAYDYALWNPDQSVIRYVVEKADGSFAVDKEVKTESESSGTVTPAAATATATVVKDLPKVKISKVKKLKKGFKVTWKKLSKAKKKKIAKVQIQYSRSKNFKSADTKTKLVKKSKTSAKIKKLKSKKKYYVRVRAYKVIDGTVHVSKWSKTLKVKTK